MRSLVGLVFPDGDHVVTGCEQGPAEKVGSEDRPALDKLSGKGPLEKAGERVDKAVEELKK